MNNGLSLKVVNNEVCATYYEQRRVDAEIKTVTAKFEKVCKDEAVCNAYKTIPLNTQFLPFRSALLLPPLQPMGMKDQLNVQKNTDMSAIRNLCLFL